MSFLRAVVPRVRLSDEWGLTLSESINPYLTYVLYLTTLGLHLPGSAISFLPDLSFLSFLFFSFLFFSFRSLFFLTSTVIQYTV